MKTPGCTVHPDKRLPFLRDATIADAGAIHRLETSAVQQQWRGHYTDAQIAAWCRMLTSEYHAGCIEMRRVLVAEADGELKGFGQLDLSAHRIISLYVLPACVRRGIGVALLHAMEELSRQAGLAEVKVSASLNAVGFYVRAGYQPERRTTFQLPGRIMLDAVCMRRPLS